MRNLHALNLMCGFYWLLFIACIVCFWKAYHIVKYLQLDPIGHHGINKLQPA